MRKTKKILIAIPLILATIMFVSFIDTYKAKGADSYTKLLIHSDNSNAELLIFRDYSQYLHSITPAGDVTHSTAQTKFGQTSMLFDGTGDYLSLADSADWNLAAADWTIEAWVRTGAAGTIMAQAGDGADLSMKWEVTAGDKLKLSLSTDGTTWGKTVTSTTSVGSASAFVHVAAVRNGATVTQYIGGTADATTLDVTGVTVNDSGVALFVGSSAEGTPVPFNGYMDEVRISNGIARWAASFTPATSMYGADEFDQVTLSLDVQEVLTLDCGADIDLGALRPGTPVSGSTTCSVTTNAQSGYDLAVKRDDADTTLDHTTDAASNITDKTAWTSGSPDSATWTGTGIGFGVFASTATKNTTWWGTGAACHDASNKYAGFPSAYDIIMHHTSYASSATTTSICYRVDVPATQKSGEYDGTITYQATTLP
jgi:hypothetical protein